MSWVKHSLMALLVCGLSGFSGWGFSKAPTGGKSARQGDALQKQLSSQTLVARAGAIDTTNTAAGDWAHRMRFADLGLADGVVLSREQPLVDVYVPVPAQVPLSKVTWSLPLRQVTSTTSRAWLSVSVNDQPVAHWALGSISSDQLLQGVAKAGLVPGGFLRLTLRLDIEHGKDELGQVCTAPVSVVIDPSAHVSYQTPAGAQLSVGDAWVLLPPVTNVMVPPGAMSIETYQTAWAVGTTLLRARRQQTFSAFASMGETVDTALIEVPNGWLDIPAFQALSSRSTVSLADPAQWAAWVLLQMAGPSAASGVVLVDAPFVKSVSAGLDALSAQVVAANLTPDVLNAVTQWQSVWLKRLQQAVEQPIVHSVPTVAGGVLLLGSSASAAFSQLVDPHWAALLRASGAQWLARSRPAPNSSELRLTELGLPTGAFSMLYRHEWTGVLDLSNPGLSGELPHTWVFDIATPAATMNEQPTVSLYLNDQLLASQVLSMDGKTQRVIANLPASAVQVRNVLRAVFLRRGDHGHCFVAPWSFSIADTSHVTTHSRELLVSFVGAGRAMAKGGNLLVSQQELSAPLASVPTLVWAGEAMALDVNRTKVQPTPGAAAAWPTPFMTHLGKGGSLKLPANEWLNEALVGIKDGLTARVVSHEGGLGLVLQAQGSGLDVTAPVSMFNHGSMGVFNAQGRGQLWDEAGRTRDTFQDEMREPWLRRNMGWWIPLLLVFAFVGLLVAASVVRRKRVS